MREHVCTGKLLELTNVKYKPKMYRTRPSILEELRKFGIHEFAIEDVFKKHIAVFDCESFCRGIFDDQESAEDIVSVLELDEHLASMKKNETGLLNKQHVSAVGMTSKLGTRVSCLLSLFLKVYAH